MISNYQTTWMKKSITVLFLLIMLTVSAFTQEGMSTDEIYEARKDSVFLVNQSLYIDKAAIGNVELFKKLEISMDKKILDQYLPLGNGTAFLINKEGYLITAAHVVKTLDHSDKYRSGEWSIVSLISRNSIPGYLSRNELHKLIRIYLKYIQSREIVISIKTNNKKVYKAEVIAEDSGLDLALLKIDLEEDLEPFAIYDDKEIKVGDSVITLGFPLQSLLDSFLDDFKSTLTDGVVSAIRSDRWDLQHTASINGGNSGGPLLNKDGELIGVNVGQITNANDIYFSTNASKIVNWLKKIGKDHLISNE